MSARGFRDYFTPLPGCFSPFPHGTYSAIGRWEYLAFERGRPCFPPGYTCRAVLRCHRRASSPSPTGLSPAAVRRSRSVQLGNWLMTRCSFGRQSKMVLQPPTDIGLPPTESLGFRLVPVRSPLLGECVSVPRGTEMVQFPRCPRPSLCVQDGVTSYKGGRVAPFGDPRIGVLARSPRRFVGLPRPSSAPSA